MPDVLKVTRSGPLATVTMNRPDSHNALNADLIGELTRYFEEQSKNARAKFDLALSRHGLRGDWLEIRAEAPTLSETVSEIGRSADLVVLSETNREGRTGGELDFAENDAPPPSAPEETLEVE